MNYEPVWEKKDIGFDADMEDSVKITADAALMELVWNNLFFQCSEVHRTGRNDKAD